MAMSLIWTAMVGAAILCGLAQGNGAAVAKGALDGAAAGVALAAAVRGVCIYGMRVNLSKGSEGFVKSLREHGPEVQLAVGLRIPVRGSRLIA